MNLEKIPTSDKSGKSNGWMLPLYRKTDLDFEGYDLRFIYASAVAPGAVKGPHMHLKRECRLVALSGEISVVVRRNGVYEETVLSSVSPSYLIIETGTPFCVRNKGNEEAILLNLANHIWTADDRDNFSVSDWTYGD